MKRFISAHLDAWRTSTTRKPMILLGARQIGKTHSLREFGKRSFAKVHEFNFQAQTSMRKIFSGDLDPARIVRELEFASNQTIQTNGEDLIFLDEIQDCSEALTSLKYFCENMPQLPIVAAGSLLGLHLAPTSFPVGKVELLHMFPMSFFEFLEAAGSSRDVAIFQQALEAPKTLPEIAHERFWLFFKNYLITGGLPESISTWLGKGGIQGGLKACSASQDKLATLITSYTADVSKHAGKTNAMHIERVWRSVPERLASAMDDSTSRFIFKDVIPGLASYRDLAGPIDWLHKAGMLLRVPICHAIATPLAAYTKNNIFKLYMFDSGILAAMLAMKPRAVMDFDFGSYKGFYAENFVAQELLASSPVPTNPLSLHSWSEGRAEIEFILASDDGVVPIEVKSGNKIRARSLKSYIERYKPKTSVVLSARSPSINAQGDTKMINLPLYMASALHRIS